MRAHLVHAQFAHARQQGQADGADARMELGHSRTLGDPGAHVLDDALRDIEIALAERAGRVMHRRAREALDHGGGSAPVLEIRAENGVGALAVRVEPQAVQFVAEPLADQVEAGCQGRGRRAVGDQHDLRGLRAALHHHLQVAGEACMRGFRIAGHVGVDEAPAHDRDDAVDQRVMDAAVGDRHHAVRAELEHPDLGRARPAANGKP